MDGLYVPFNAGRGRPRIFNTPDELLAAFEEYVKERIGQPIVEVETEKGSTGQNDYSKEKRKEHPQLLSILDFCVHLGTSRNWWNELPDEFLGVKGTIASFLENYQLKGATIGVFNANIISRLLGLTEKTETTTQAAINVQLAPDAMAGLQQALKTGAQPRKPKDEQ